MAECWNKSESLYFLYIATRQNVLSNESLCQILIKSLNYEKKLFPKYCDIAKEIFQKMSVGIKVDTADYDRIKTEWLHLKSLNYSRTNSFYLFVDMINSLVTNQYFKLKDYKENFHEKTYWILHEASNFPNGEQKKTPALDKWIRENYKPNFKFTDAH